MINEDKSKMLELLRQKHKAVNLANPRYDVNGMIFDKNGLLGLMDTIIDSGLPSGITNGVGKVKHRITYYGEDPNAYLVNRRSAYEEYRRYKKGKFNEREKK